MAAWESRLLSTAFFWRCRSTPVKSAVQLIEVKQKLTQGMSGGPLLDANDAVAGVIHKGGPTEGRDFVVNINELQDWLKDD